MWIFALGAPDTTKVENKYKGGIASISSCRTTRHGRCSAKDKKRRKLDTGQNAAARCFLTNLKLLT